MAKHIATEDQIQFIVENYKMDDNDLLGALVQKGIPFNDTKRILKEVLEDKGLRLSKPQRDEKAAELLADFNPTEETEIDEVNETIENLVQELDVTANVARAYVRAVFVAVEIAMPKAAGGGGKKGPRTPGFAGNAKIVSDAVINNPDITIEELRTVMEEAGKDKTAGGADNVTKWFPFVADLRLFGKAWEAKHCG